jgi:hypothetical protein
MNVEAKSTTIIRDLISRLEHDIIFFEQAYQRDLVEDNNQLTEHDDDNPIYYKLYVRNIIESLKTMPESIREYVIEKLIK